MKSVGEVMAIGRTFKESLFKGFRSLEAVKPLRLVDIPDEELQRKLARPNSQRFSYITYALQNGYSIEEVHRLSNIDPWFLDQLAQVMELQETLDAKPLADYTRGTLRKAKNTASPIAESHSLPARRT
jgi:carbamoyl-phosphate synthase large subunit